MHPHGRATVNDFVAVDVETANASLASICQVGVAAFADGAPAETWSEYPEYSDYSEKKKKARRVDGPSTFLCRLGS